MGVRALRELKSGQSSDIIGLLRAFQQGRDPQTMTGGELHALVSWLSRCPAAENTDIEDRLMRLRCLRDKKRVLAQHIRNHCWEEGEGGAATMLPPSARLDEKRDIESHQSSRSSHPEYSAGGQMSVLLYPQLRAGSGPPPRRSPMHSLPEQQQQLLPPVGDSCHQRAPRRISSGASCEGLVFQDEGYRSDLADGRPLRDAETPDRLRTPGTVVRSELIETQEQVIDQLRTQVAALTAMLHQGVTIQLPHSQPPPSSVRVWYGAGASPGRGWQWVIEDI